MTALLRFVLNARRIAGVLVCALVMHGCALIVPQSAGLAESWPADLPPHVELAGVPFFMQEEFECGPASLAMALSYAGEPVTPLDLKPEVYLPGRHGSLQVEMLASPRRHGIVSYALDGQLESVLREVAAGTPVIVLQDFGVWPFKIWHYAVVVGYDRRDATIVMRSGTHERQVAPWAALEYTWSGSEHWAMVAMPPQHVPVTAAVGPYTEAVTAMARVAPVQRSRVAYEALLARWPHTFAAEVGLANALYAMKDLARSEELLRDALRQQPASVPVLNNLAQVLADEGRIAEARAFLAEAEQAPGPYASALADTRRSIEKRAQ